MKTFLIIWGGQLCSVLGTYLTSFALGIWVFQQKGSTTDYALIFLCTILPNVIVAPFAGTMVDRLNRRSVMLAADTVAACGTATLLAFFLSGELALWHIYLVTVISSIANAFQQPAYYAAIGQLLPDHQLSKANGLVQVAEGTGQLIAPLLAAILISRITLGGIILIDMVTFLIAVSTLFLIRIPNLPRAVEKEPIRHDPFALGNLVRRTLREIVEGVHILKSRTGLPILLLFMAASNFISAAMLVLAAPLVLSFASVEALGWLNLVCGLGLLAGSLLSTVQRRSLGPVRLILAGQILSAFAAMVAGATTILPLLGVAAFLFFFAGPIIAANNQTLWHRHVPLEFQGRVFSLRNMVTWAAMPLAYLCAGPLADRVFEPLFRENSFLSNHIGQWIGTGPGRGIGAMLILLGGCYVLITLPACFSTQLKRLDHHAKNSPPPAIPSANHPDQTTKSTRRLSDQPS